LGKVAHERVCNEHKAEGREAMWKAWKLPNCRFLENWPSSDCRLPNGLFNLRYGL
jgi:hypothetical protein